MKPELGQDALDLVAELTAMGARFLIVGAHALAVHGVVRGTADLDLLMDAQPANAARVMAALRAFGAPVGTHGLTVEDLTRPGTVYQLGVAPNRIDLLTSITRGRLPDRVGRARRSNRRRSLAGPSGRQCSTSANEPPLHEQSCLLDILVVAT